MMDNDQPWQPPEQPRIVQMPKVSPTVPDITIFSPSSNLPAAKKNNFMQRAQANEKVMSSSQKIKHSVPIHLAKPSVPDLSLFDPPVLNAANRNTVKPPTNYSQNVFAKSNASSKENIFLACSKPSVPDLTILEEEPQKKVSAAGSDQVFSESYKKMLIKSHEQFMKQMKNDVHDLPKQPNKKSVLFNPQRYQDNPLRKYAPAPPPVAYDKDVNSSSILVEFEEEPAQAVSEDKTDEMTFKKVAEMLSKIQKLVIPGQSTPEDSPRIEPRNHVLRKLATAYLTPEELLEFEVDKELKQMEA